MSTEFHYRVVVNDEQQYALWPAHKAAATGWRDAGFAGDKAACLDHVGRVWTDMRPLSLRGRS
ncbi:MbtH family protein [Actinokineospora sp. 24-640]